MLWRGNVPSQGWLPGLGGTMQTPEGLLSLTVLLAEAALIFAALVAIVGFLYRKAFREVTRYRSAEQQVRNDRAAYLEYIRGKLQRLATKYGMERPESARPLHAALVRSPMSPHEVGVELFREFLAAEVRATEKAIAGSASFWSIRHSETRSILKSFEAAAQAMAGSERTAMPGEVTETAAPRRDDARIAQLQSRLAKRDARIGELEREVEQLESYRARFLELHGSAVAEMGANQDFRSELREGLRRDAGGEEVEELLSRYEVRRNSHEKLVGRYDMYFSEASEGAQWPDEPGEEGAGTARWRSALSDSQAAVDDNTAQLVSALEEQSHLIGALKDKLDRATEKELKLRQYYNREIRQLEQNAHDNQTTLKTLQHENYRLKRRVRRLLTSGERELQRGQGRQRMETALETYSKQALDAQARVKVVEAQLAQAHRENRDLKRRLEAGDLTGGAALLKPDSPVH